MAGLVFPNDAGQINYALCMGHNYTGTDPFQSAVPRPLTALCLVFHIIHQLFRVFFFFFFFSVGVIYVFSSFISQMFKMERSGCIVFANHNDLRLNGTNNK